MEKESLKSKEDIPEKSSVLDLDKVITDEVGAFGRYQQKAIALAALMVLFISWDIGEFVFTTARIPTRCLIPECETSTSTQFSPAWLGHAVPSYGNTFDQCHRFASNSSSTNGNDTCAAKSFDRNTVVMCKEFVYQNKDTIVYDFRLACDEWHRSLIGSAHTLGTLTSLPLAGYVSDRWGRRTALALTALTMSTIGISRYFSISYIMYLISEFAGATLGAGNFSCIFILLIELVGSQYRVLISLILNTTVALGFSILGFISSWIPNWRQLTLIIYIPQLFFISYLWIMSESVRWYVSKGRSSDAEKVLRQVARTNGKELSEETVNILRQATADKRDHNVNKPWLIVQVFRHKPILLRCLISPVWWITFTLVYYGMMINSVNLLSGNKNMNFVFVSACDIPGYWIAMYLLWRHKRRPVLAGAFWICAACQIGYIFTPAGHYGISLTLYLLGKCSISSVSIALYLYTVELYPTECRHSLFAFSSMVGRIGSILAPLTSMLGDKVPAMVFGGMALLSGLLVLLTPETLGSKFPDTMEEAARIGNKKPHTNNES